MKQAQRPEEILVPALHVKNLQEGIEAFEELNGLVKQFKIGQRAISRGVAHDLTNYIQHNGGRVFWDAKWNDVPEEVSESMKGLNETLNDEVWMVSIHASSGPNSIRAALENRSTTQVFMVTVLTSIDNLDCEQIFTGKVEEVVLDFAELFSTWANQSVQGLICSPNEVEEVKKLGLNLPVLTPGVGSVSNTRGQVRVATAQQAVINGADFVVVGNEIMNSENRVKATYKILEQIEQGLRIRNG